MLEDIIHGPKSSNEGIEKIQTFGAPLDPKGRAATFLSKLKAQARRAETNLFEGVNVYFTGYTDKLSALQLKNQLHKHGALTSYAFSASYTTHVVCTNLCASKIKSFASLKRKIHIVHPNWIIDSIKSAQLKLEKDYEILPSDTKSTILSYVEKVPNPTISENAESAHSVATSEPHLSPNCSTSLSLSSDGSQEVKKQPKRVNHPLLRIRRSADTLSSHASEKLVKDQLEPITLDKSPIVAQTIKQARFSKILQKRSISSAQKTFSPPH